MGALEDIIVTLIWVTARTSLGTTVLMHMSVHVQKKLRLILKGQANLE